MPDSNTSKDPKYSDSDEHVEYDYDKYERQYEMRNERLQQVIDTLAQYEAAEINTHGFKTELARQEDLDKQRIHYVLDRWGDLVRHRRNANRNPLDAETVKNAYDDETMRAMAEGNSRGSDDDCTCVCGETFDTPSQRAGHQTHCPDYEHNSVEPPRQESTQPTPNQAVADGGQVTIPIRLQMDEIFRSVKLLPSDLSMKFFQQTIQQGDELPREELNRLFEANGDERPR